MKYNDGRTINYPNARSVISMYESVVADTLWVKYVRRCVKCKNSGKEKCDSCRGFGECTCDMGHQHECDVCDGYGEAICEACWKAEIGGKTFDSHYLEKINTIPGVVKYGISKNAMVIHSNTGVSAILMAMGE